MRALTVFFLIVATLAAAGAGELSLELIPFPDKRYKDRVNARFINASDKTIRLLKPMDGSSRSLIYPHYASSVVDNKGRALPVKDGWCGLIWFWSNWKWPEDYLVELKPGESFQMPFVVIHQVPESGEYTVTLRYAFKPKHGEKIFNESYPPGLWTGEVTSMPLKVMLEKN